MAHRPRTAVTKSATILALYLGAAVAAAAASFAGLPGAGPTLVGVVSLVAAFVVGQQLVWYPRWAQMGGLVAAATLVICGSLAVGSSVLSWRGERVEAVVTDVSVVGSPHPRAYLYVLTDAQGRRIPGRLREDLPEFDLGDKLSVVVDRGNWVAPETTDEVAAARPLWTAAAIGLALTAVISVLGTWRPRAGQPPSSGPGGIWIFNR